jgi:hypothetical protein
MAVGLTKDVTREPADDTINDRVDDAYRMKYNGSSYLDPMIGTRVRTTTVRVVAGTRKSERSTPAR